MRKVFAASDNITTSLGFSTRENMLHMISGETGIRLWDDDKLAPSPFWASLVDRQELTLRLSALTVDSDLTLFEQLAIWSVKDALTGTPLDLTDSRTLLILSTTKGNIDLLQQHPPRVTGEGRIYLWQTAKHLQRILNLRHTPWVVSNACISGVLAVTIGARLIRAGEYDHVIVTGVDLVTEFVLSGFNSFLSLSHGPCRPFDKERQGLSLGEGAGTLILTADESLGGPVCVGFGYSSNDANHISGPSRTGEGLYTAIRRTMEKNNRPVDYISAHGTATPYNDEMESVALFRAGLHEIPVNSFKGYWGHTLGAAGIIESVAGIYSLKNNRLFKTQGFETCGVSKPINVIQETTEKQLDAILKIASGFGGCNAALIFYR